MGFGVEWACEDLFFVYGSQDAWEASRYGQYLVFISVSLIYSVLGCMLHIEVPPKNQFSPSPKKGVI